MRLLARVMGATIVTTLAGEWESLLVGGVAVGVQGACWELIPAVGQVCFVVVLRQGECGVLGSLDEALIRGARLVLGRVGLRKTIGILLTRTGMVWPHHLNICVLLQLVELLPSPLWVSLGQLLRAHGRRRRGLGRCLVVRLRIVGLRLPQREGVICLLYVYLRQWWLLVWLHRQHTIFLQLIGVRPYYYC